MFNIKVHYLEKFDIVAWGCKQSKKNKTKTDCPELK